MNLHNYLEKLRAKPVREKERIAVVATIIGFFIFVGIWVASFNEMNKAADTEVDPAAASLNDLKDNFEIGKDSIQDMMQQLPSQTGALGTDNSAGNALPAPSTDSIQNMDNNNPIESNSSDQKENSVPQLP